MNENTYDDVIKFLDKNGFLKLRYMFLNKQKLLYTQISYSGDVALYYDSDYNNYKCQEHDGQYGGYCQHIEFLYINCPKCYRYYLNVLDILTENVTFDIYIRDIYYENTTVEYCYGDSTDHALKHICTSSGLLKLLELIRDTLLVEYSIEDLVSRIRII